MRILDDFQKDKFKDLFLEDDDVVDFDGAKVILQPKAMYPCIVVDEYGYYTHHMGILQALSWIAGES